jgi:predicted nucleotidyltransferase
MADAGPILSTLARVLSEHGLEAVLIGNAAAALQGAPVTTLDLDFMFRKTPGNLRKLKAVAASLGAMVLRPYYPMSDLFRVVRDEDSLQVDFMATVHGVRSFESLGSRAQGVHFGGHKLLVADLADIIRSKRAAGRPRDRAVLEVLEKTLEERKKAAPRSTRGSQTGN